MLLLLPIFNIKLCFSQLHPRFPVYQRLLRSQLSPQNPIVVVFSGFFFFFSYNCCVHLISEFTNVKETQLIKIANGFLKYNICIILRSSVNFKFIFVYAARDCSNFTLLNVAIQLSKHRLLKRLSSLHLYILAFLNCRLIDHGLQGYPTSQS